jgi:L-ascorbate metabolism protein UlaG (beta-lactamase superfamily)
MTYQNRYESDLFSTSEGDLKITFLGHGSLLFEFKGMFLYIDPYSEVADYAQLPKAEVIMLTHEHRDHLDMAAIDNIRKQDTIIVASAACAAQTQVDVVLQNGEEVTVEGLTVRAVPAYNLVHLRENGQPFHPKGVGNGYVIDFVDLRVYVAGDTENIPEMRNLKEIDVAFLPMNLPYTMTPEMVTQAVEAFKPRIVYPYHYGKTDPDLLSQLLKGEQVEVRIRKLA